MTLHRTLTALSIVFMATSSAAQISAPVLKSDDRAAPPLFGTPDTGAPVMRGKGRNSASLLGQSSGQTLASDLKAEPLTGRPGADDLTGRARANTLHLTGSDTVPPPVPEPVRPPAPPAPPAPIVLQDLTFENDSARLTERSLESIRRHHGVIRSYPHHRLMLHSHASAPGSESYNLELSRRRGSAVRAALIELGVEPSRISIEAHGEANLLRDGDTQADHRMNRRVEIHFY